MCSGLWDIGSEPYRYRERNVRRGEVVKAPKGNGTVRRRRKQYGSTTSGGDTQEVQGDRVRSKVRANRKALRFPGGEGLMPPAVWGLQPCYSFPTVTHGSPTPLTATCFLSSFTYFLNLIKPETMRVSLE